MKAFGIPDETEIAAIAIEPGEHLIIKSRKRLRPESLVNLREALARGLPGVHCVILDGDFDIATVKPARPVETTEEPMNLQNPEENLETRDAALAFAEHRTYEATEIRVAKGDDGKTHVTGYAAVFNSRSKPLKTKTGKTFVEQIQPGAFKRSLDSGKDIVMLYNHDPSKVLARTSAKTLKLSEDDRGLKFDATLPDTTLGRDVEGDVNHGNVRGMSFGFNDPEDRWDMDGNVPVRTLLDVPFGEVSATPFPAYPDTQISVRAIDLAIDRVAAGEPDVRGKYTPDDDDLKSHVEGTRSMVRAATEYVHQTLRALQQHGDPDSADEHLVTAVRDLHGAMGECRSKMAECRSHIDENYLDDDDDDDVPQPGDPDEPGEMPSSRARLEKQLAVALEAGLPVDELRAALDAMAETRAGESVDADCAARARKAIADGKIDNGDWEAPGQGDRDQADCLGAGKSYPIFKGEKVSVPALRNAASRGAQHAPAVGKEASALLDLVKKKDDGKKD